MSVQEHNRRVLEEMRAEGPTVKRAKGQMVRVQRMEHEAFVLQAKLDGLKRELIVQVRELQVLLHEAARKDEQGWSQPVLKHAREVLVPFHLEGGSV